MGFGFQQQVLDLWRFEPGEWKEVDLDHAPEDYEGKLKVRFYMDQHGYLALQIDMPPETSSWWSRTADGLAEWWKGSNNEDTESESTTSTS